MPVHDQSGDAAFAACLRLFRSYPLAVRRHYAEHRYGSMVLMTRDTGTARFFVLVMEWDDVFVLRPWDRRDGARLVIGPDEPVPGEAWRVIETGVPVPRDGALLGWVTGRQVQAVLAACGRLPEPWDDASAVPDVLVMPLAGSQWAGWGPPGTSPLGEGRLWEHVARGRLADLGPVIALGAGRVFWVPGDEATTGRRGGARVVVTERLSADGLWLPAGVYAGRRAGSEGATALTASQLLALPGVIDLAGGRHQHLLGV